MKILFAVDGSDYTRRALDYLETHDWLRAGNHVTVFTAVPPVPHRAAAFAGPQLTHLYYDSDAQTVLGPIRERLAGCAADVAYAHVVGHVGQAIADRATSGHFDLIVMGSHGHGALANVVLGSVATRVLASCTTPVLLVR